MGYVSLVPFQESNDNAYIGTAGSLLCTASYVQERYWIELCLPAGFAGVAHAGLGHSTEARMWHRRFGHLGFETLARMSSFNMLTGSDLKQADFLQARSRVRETCIVIKQLAKMHTSPIVNLTTKALGLVFSDTAGNPTKGCCNRNEFSIIMYSNPSLSRTPLSRILDNPDKF